MQKRDLIQANASLENLRQNLDMKDIAKEILLEENYNKFIRSYKFQFVGAVMFFPPTHPFKKRCTPQGNTPLAAARGLAALHPARRATAN